MRRGRLRVFGMDIPHIKALTCVFSADEQFHRFMSQSNERIAKYRIRMILTLQDYLDNPEVW
jgi:hypothetical protein